MQENVNLNVIFEGDFAARLHRLRQIMAKLVELESAWERLADGEQAQQMVWDSLEDVPGACVVTLSDADDLPVAGASDLGPPPDPPGDTGDYRPPLKRKRTDVYWEILEARGAPMHVREITAEALRLGLDLTKGNTSPADKVRGSLYGSKKFTNVGSNWWVISQSSSPDYGEDKASI